ncbi:hypothetical protein GMD48_19450 [Proteus mirabilis]|nr:hypothetical protein [Proteus mirabilis]MTT48228.1 hypothetical protein [Proteus mirabilis]
MAKGCLFRDLILSCDWLRSLIRLIVDALLHLMWLNYCCCNIIFGYWEIGKCQAIPIDCLKHLTLNIENL